MEHWILIFIPTSFFQPSFSLLLHVFLLPPTELSVPRRHLQWWWLTAHEATHSLHDNNKKPLQWAHSFIPFITFQEKKVDKWSALMPDLTARVVPIASLQLHHTHGNSIFNKNESLPWTLHCHDLRHDSCIISLHMRTIALTRGKCCYCFDIRMHKSINFHVLMWETWCIFLL